VGGRTVRRSYTAQQIISKLRKAEAHLSQDLTVGEAGRKMEITDEICYRWCKEYSGIRMKQTKRPNDLEKRRF